MARALQHVEGTADVLSASLYCLGKTSFPGYKVGKCNCGDSEHHKEMSEEARLEHLKECLGDVIERMECIRSGLDEIGATR
ncbi:MAG: hypothetical protein R6V83_08180 [Candidatus Thorarchaeota archaeon]